MKALIEVLPLVLGYQSLLIETITKQLENKLFSKKYYEIESLCRLAGLTFQKDDIGNALISHKIINLVYEDEDSIENISNFLTICFGNEDDKLTTLANEIIQKVIDFAHEKTNLNSESQAIKNIKELITKTAEICPKLIYNSLPILITLYDNEV